jgi:hypothetical protein
VIGSSTPRKKIVFEKANLVIQKNKPKLRDSWFFVDSHDVDTPVASTQDVTGKAGKTSFFVLIGHEEYLYKSSISTRYQQNRPQTIDLHGCTKERQ